MLRFTKPICAPVFVKIVDFVREADATTRSAKGFIVSVDLGPGVKEVTVHQLQEIIDEQMAKHSKFGTVRTGRVFNAANQPVVRVVAGEKYIVTGNLRGGFIKPDSRFGPRLSGYHGATTKPGLRWNGDEL
eukprot:GDKK01015637.1.p1 GENE.GDKK01015637.1~~GDKK01015637.1.p1  ORF type:complete len:131 (+),score=4.46 GDKK01015637.1:17-409(+)